MKTTKLQEQVENLQKQIEQAICEAITNGAEIKRDMVWRNEIDGVPVFFNIDGKPYMSIQLEAEPIAKALRRDDEELIAQRDRLLAKAQEIEDELQERIAERAAA